MRKMLIVKLKELDTADLSSSAQFINQANVNIIVSGLMGKSVFQEGTNSHFQTKSPLKQLTRSQSISSKALGEIIFQVVLIY